MNPTRKRLPHDIPNWIDPTQEAYFITINCHTRGKNQLARDTTWKQIVESVTFREQRDEWQWKLILAMPDHLHGIVTFPKHFSMKSSISNWKRWLSTQESIVWQDGFFDHRLRSAESAVEKANYIRMNPVRAGLAISPEAWPFRRDWQNETQ